MTEHLNAQSFSDHLHTTFQMNVAEGTSLPLELVEVIEYTNNPKLDQFCLILRGPRDPWVQQKIYTLEHAALGKMDLFVAPLGFDDQGMRYQIIFSRFRK